MSEQGKVTRQDAARLAEYAVIGPTPPSKPLGNGAREALTEIETADKTPTLCWADWLLAELYARGFKVVPVEASDAN